MKKYTTTITVTIKPDFEELIYDFVDNLAIYTPQFALKATVNEFVDSYCQDTYGLGKEAVSMLCDEITEDFFNWLQKHAEEYDLLDVMNHEYDEICLKRDE